MRWKRFGELLKNKELCLFCFYGKETGKKEMIKREIATFRKGFGEGDLESLKIVLLFIIMKKIWAHYLTTQLFILLLKCQVPQSDHLQNLKLIFRKFEVKHIRWLEEFSLFFEIV